MRNISLAHINVRSLLAHHMPLSDFINNSNYDVVAMSETWLTSETQDVFMRGYKFHRLDRTGRGGGVGMFVRDGLRCERLDLSVSESFVEMFWIRLWMGKDTVCVGVLYRPPQADFNLFLSTFEDTLHYLFATGSPIYCLGDFNIDLLNRNFCKTSQFNDLLVSLDLTQIIAEPTRISHNSVTLIDLIITNARESVQGSGVVELDNVSDHLLIYCELHFPKPKYNISRTYRDFSNFNYDNFKQDLEAIPWHVMFSMTCCDTMVSFLNENIISLFNFHAPLRHSIFHRPKAPWITGTIKIMQSLRNKARAQYNKTKDEDKFRYYKTLRNLVNNSIDREKKAYLEHSLSTKPYKEVWKHLKVMNVHSNLKTCGIPEHLSNANNINSYFLKSANPLPIPNSVSNFYCSNLAPNSSFFEFAQTDEEAVLRAVQGIASGATGHDGVNIVMLKYCLPFLLPYLTFIFNFCLIHSVFPAAWKHAIVLPLPKCKDPMEYKDLRPISILSTVAKIFEKIIASQMKEYLEKNKILPEVQSGFRSGHSCATALATITDDILTALDKRRLTVLVLLDFSKAFDTINHKLLLSVLTYAGFSKGAVAFFDNYLRSRSQAVRVCETISDSLVIDSGVPQGSVLGPILFTIYTLNFGSYVKNCNFHLYADDTQLYYSFELERIDDAVTIVNSDLNSVLKFSNDHGLRINPSKTQAIMFGYAAARVSALNTFRVNLNNTHIKFSDTAKSLGVVLDYKLRFKENTNLLIQRAFSNLKFLYSCRNILNGKLKKQLCDSLVLSHFNFCDNVYGPCLDAVDSARVQRIQKACVRFICGLRSRTSVSSKIEEMGWLSMENRRFLHCASMFHRVLAVSRPSYLHRKITYRTDVHNLNTRFRGRLSPPLHRTELFKRSFSYQVVNVMNQIPLEVIQFSSKKFSLRVRALLMGGRLPHV